MTMRQMRVQSLLTENISEKVRQTRDNNATHVIHKCEKSISLIYMVKNE